MPGVLVRADSQTARLLAVLADGRWHLSRELHERCGYMRTNSRIAELRARGHVIAGESVPGKTGTDGYRYRLLSTLDADPTAGVANGAPPAACPAGPTEPASASTSPATGNPLLSAVAGEQLSLVAA